MPERRTVQIKTPIAGNSQSIAKIGNAAMRRSELAHFNKQMLIHELIRGSLPAVDRHSGIAALSPVMYAARNPASYNPDESGILAQATSTHET